MKSPLRILHLEDDLNDAELVRRTLESEGITCVITRVENGTDFVTVLERGGVDLIIADYNLPGFDGMSALAIARAHWPDVPFVVVSGRIGEELSIEALKSGATDYVLKDRLPRLVPVVRRAMKEVEARSERRHLAEQLTQSQKLEVVGHLVGGVVHDFNNMLGIIMGYSDIIMLKLTPGDVVYKQAKEIRHAADRAAALTQQLLIFSSKQTVELVVLDLNEALETTDKMLRQLIGENIELLLLPGDALGRIKADSGHIGQVLMNMVVNARDAMPKGGKLTIATNNATFQEGKTPPGVTPGHYVTLTITDTGIGMSDEIKARLFEAFFTTKPRGKGTGLGLATCQTIAQQCGGHIGLESEPGRGTTFTVYFPRIDQPLETTVRPVESASLPLGTETLLLAEDEPGVRHLARDVLEAQGYEVLSACNGLVGLQMVREHQGRPIDLVITDVIMPIMGGKVMAEWLAATYPGLKILFTSGYTDDTVTRQGMLEPGVSFLSKPYTPATLTRKVREMLDASQ